MESNTNNFGSNYSTEPPAEIPPSSTKKMILFSFPRISSALLLGLIGFALFTLYTTGFGLDETKVTNRLTIGYIAIAISQPFFGWISDVTYIKKLGGRKPFVFLLAPVLVVSFLLLMMPSLVLENPSDETLLTWFFIWNTLFEVAYAVTTPYQAWMAQLFNTADRPKCSQIQNIANFIGQVIQTLFAMLILTDFAVNIESNPNYIPPEYLWGCILFAATFIISFYTSAILMPTEPQKVQKSNLLENLKVALKNAKYQKVVFMQGFASIGWVMAGTVILKYLTDVLQLNMMQNIIVSGSMIIGMVIFLEFWKRMIAKKGKTQSIKMVFIFGAIVMPLSLIGLIYVENTLWFGLLLVWGYAFVLGGWYLFPYIMYADLAEDDERQTNVQKAGLYIGYPSIILNLFQAFGVFLLGQLYKFGDTTVGTNTFNLGNVLWGPVVSIILIGVYFYTKKYVLIDFEWAKSDK
ncbi:MAG: MFS transporter [Promethearchaeota archaeon]